jgi:hypothetical protein
MCVVVIGNCDRCGAAVKDKPGLGYADARGLFDYCQNCLEETGLGFREARKRKPYNEIWLEDVIKQDTLPTKVSFFLGKAKKDWYRLRNIKCRCCSPWDLKLRGKCKNSA